jgi:hypothetical protein
MTIKKTAELYFKNNDIYILENHGNTIIINNNNQGLLLLDHSLHIQKELSIPQEAPIYSIYKKYDNSALVLYLPDAHQIIFVDLNTSNNCIITLPKSFYKEILSSNYYWNNNTLILTTVNNTFYQLDIASKALHQISYDEAKTLCLSFFAFWNICKEYNVLTFYPDKESIIVQNNDNTLGFFSYQQNKQHIITEFTDDWHDIEYNNGFFLLIHENKIELLQNNHKIVLRPHASFIFLKVKFINDNHFVVLSGNPSHYQESLLEIYTIDKPSN